MFEQPKLGIPQAIMAAANHVAKQVQGGGELTTIFVLIKQSDGAYAGQWRVGTQIVQESWLPGWHKALHVTADRHKQAMRESGVSEFRVIETRDPRARQRSHQIWPPIS